MLKSKESEAIILELTNKYNKSDNENKTLKKLYDEEVSKNSSKETKRDQEAQKKQTITDQEEFIDYDNWSDASEDEVEMIEEDVNVKAKTKKQ